MNDAWKFAEYYLKRLGALDDGIHRVPQIWGIDASSIENVQKEKEKLLKNIKENQSKTLAGDDHCDARDYVTWANQKITWLEILLENLEQDLHS